jgi:hypothetical protein
MPRNLKKKTTKINGLEQKYFSSGCSAWKAELTVRIEHSVAA